MDHGGLGAHAERGSGEVGCMVLTSSSSRGRCARPSSTDLTCNGTVIETGPDSYRLVSTRARAGKPAASG